MEDVLIRAKIIELRQALGWNDKDEFKFSRTRKEVVKDFLQQVTKRNFKVYGVVLDKQKYNPITTKNRYSLYNTVLAELLQGINIPETRICIDGEVGKKHKKKTAAFLRQELNGKMRIGSLRFADSREVDELQLADIVTGSINRPLTDKADADDYLQLLAGKIVEIKYL